MLAVYHQFGIDMSYNNNNNNSNTVDARVQGINSSPNSVYGKDQQESQSAVREFAGIGTHVLSIIDRNLKEIAAKSDTNEDDGGESNTADRKAKEFNNERTVMYYKMKADYHRYLAEFAPEKNDDKNDNFPASRGVEIDCALSAYKIALSLAQDSLPPAHHLTMLVAHNFSTFYYSMRRSTRMACHVAKTVYEDACEHVHELNEEEYAETVRVLQLLRENISKWTLDIARGDYDSEAEESDVDDIEEDMERQLADGQDDPYSNDLETGSLLQVTQARAAQKPLGMIASQTTPNLGYYKQNNNNQSNNNNNNNMKNTMNNQSDNQGDNNINNNNFNNNKKNIDGNRNNNRKGETLQVRKDRSGSSAGSRQGSSLGPGQLRRSSTAPNLSSVVDDNGNNKHKKNNLKVDVKQSLPPSMPEHQITSLLAGHENVTTLVLDPVGKTLVPAMHELFHSYLEGSTATPVAGSFTTKGINLDNLLEEGRNSTGPQLLVKSLLRMLKDFSIIPKMLEEGTVLNCAAMSVRASKKDRKISVVLKYRTKYMLGTGNKKSSTSGSNGSGEKEGEKNENGTNDVPYIPELLSFSEFVDTLGRVGVLAIRTTPGTDQKYGNDSVGIINGFLRDYMKLYDGKLWRKMVQRPWEAAAKAAAASRPRPGSSQRELSKRLTEIGLPLNLNYLSPEFSLSKTASLRLEKRITGRALRQIFDFYRKVNTLHKVSQMSSVGRGRDVLFSQIATVNEVINLSEMQKFLLDFDVVPLIISKKEFQDVFVICMRLSDKAAMNALAKHAEDKKEKEDNAKKKHNNNSNNNSKHSKDTDDEVLIDPETMISRGVGATWPTFVDCIQRLAILADSKDQAYPTDSEKVDGFIQYLELDQPDRWRSKMKVFGAPRRTGSSLRFKKSSTYATLDPLPHRGNVAINNSASMPNNSHTRSSRLLPKVHNSNGRSNRRRRNRRPASSKN